MVAYAKIASQKICIPIKLKSIEAPGVPYGIRTRVAAVKGRLFDLFETPSDAREFSIGLILLIYNPP